MNKGDILCRDLWGSECLALLDEDDGFRCRDTNHMSGNFCEMVKEGLEAGYSPRDFIHLQKTEVSYAFTDGFLYFAAKYPEGRSFVARHVNAPVALLHQIIKAHELRVTYGIASNPNADFVLLSALSTSLDVVARANVALNRSVSDEAAMRLKDDSETMVRLNLASNTFVDVDILKIMTDDPADRVLVALAKNDRSSEEMITKLAQSDSVDVRTAAASHKNLNCDSAAALSSDFDWRVRSALAQSICGSLVNCKEILLNLSRDPNPGVRASAASNRNLPQDLFVSLAYDHDYSVRYRLAQNPSLPLDVYAMMMVDERESVRKNLFDRQDRPRFESEIDVDLHLKDFPHLAFLIGYGTWEPTGVYRDIFMSSIEGRNLPFDSFLVVNDVTVKIFVEAFLDGRVSFDRDSGVALFERFCAISNDVETAIRLYRVVVRGGDMGLLRRARDIVKTSAHGRSIRLFTAS
ncbi:MAG: hypothetical protein M0019_01835 [Actinomycetota bacterium]|nr:hypothetical protein [Actinomycetota bacterium]